MHYLALNLEDTNVNPIAKFGTIGGLLNTIVPMVLIIGSLSFLAMLLYAAFLILTAGGSADNISKAQKMATWAVIGLMVMVFSYTFMRVIANILKIQLPF
jgi:hypothetical protein